MHLEPWMVFSQQPELLEHRREEINSIRNGWENSGDISEPYKNFITCSDRKNNLDKGMSQSQYEDEYEGGNQQVGRIGYAVQVC